MKVMWALLLSVTVVTALAPSAAAGQFKKPVYYELNDVPYQIISADFNHDGALDLAVAEFVFGRVGILLGKGNGTFDSARYFSVLGAIGLAAGDFNGDHNLDLAVTESGGTGSGALAMYLGDGRGNFLKSATYKMGVGPLSAAVADFDGDGYLDVAVSIQGAKGNGSVTVLFGEGNGKFGRRAVYPLGGVPAVVATADLNGDHHPDLVVGQNGVGSVSVLINDGHGKFKKPQTYGVGPGANGIAIADLRNDGILDLAVTATPNTVAVLLGNGDGTFGTATRYSVRSATNGYPIGVVSADFNRDGKFDLAVECYSGPSALFYGNGNGTFQTPVPIKTRIGGGNSLAVGDFNNDGFPDLAMDAIGTRRRVSIAVLINAQ